MESQRLETLERQMKRMERRIRIVVTGWILSVMGLLTFGLIIYQASSVPARSVPKALAGVLTVNGIKIVDQQGRETASIDSQGKINGGLIRGGGLRIGGERQGFDVEFLVDSGGEPYTDVNTWSGRAGFNMRLSTFGVNLSVNGGGASAVRIEVGGPEPLGPKTGLKILHDRDIIWHAP